MKVISTTNLSREGNDCYIEESVSLVEQFGLYAVVQFYKVSGWGWTECVEVSVLITTSDKAAAGKKYKEYCKYYKV